MIGRSFELFSVLRGLELVWIGGRGIKILFIRVSIYNRVGIGKIF